MSAVGAPAADGWPDGLQRIESTRSVSSKFTVLEQRSQSHVLMANRKQRAATAADTLVILDRGTYPSDGTEVSIAGSLARMREGTRLYSPESIKTLVDSLEPPVARETRIDVLNCTTFSAARSLWEAHGIEPLCLNFASAKNPGGGFRSGSQAQEEALARASGLYDSISRQMAYYDVNRACRTCLYTDHAIYSPSVPVFRDDNDVLLASPYPVAIVTMPAVNAGALGRNEPERQGEIAPTMERRVRAVLGIARHHGHGSLVLGAWGCGVFGNDPRQMASWFRDAIVDDDRFRGAFDRIVFAVLDFSRGAPRYEAFREAFV